MSLVLPAGISQQTRNKTVIEGGGGSKWASWISLKGLNGEGGGWSAAGNCLCEHESSGLEKLKRASNFHLATPSIYSLCSHNYIS